MLASARKLGRFRAAAVIAGTLLVVVASIAAVIALQANASASRDAEIRLTDLRLHLSQAQGVPWSASPEEGLAVEDVREELNGALDPIKETLRELSEDGGLPEHREILVPFGRTEEALWEILELVAKDRGDETEPAAFAAGHQSALTDKAVLKAAAHYRADAQTALSRARYGAAAVILLLFVAFALFYMRASRARRLAVSLAQDKERLLVASRKEALTDALTGLANRRALVDDLEAAAAGCDDTLMVAVFDLDGFKLYNDAFGHPAGDALLARLANRLAHTLDGLGTAYRMGGDEFCVVAPLADRERAEAVAGLAASALSEHGRGFDISCSYGVALLPDDDVEADAALLRADQRMYDSKNSGRVPPSRQSADVLLRLVAERNIELGRHNSGVASYAEATAAVLGLSDYARARVRLAAELHDIGKAAIPDAILGKPSALAEEEWDFMCAHTVIGERIVSAAPSLSHTADLVRSSHERMDGTGYPDRLKGEKIPLGARIITVCDAYDAMISHRAYRDARSPEEALAELHRCSGTQFDARVVRAFVEALARRPAAAA